MGLLDKASVDKLRDSAQQALQQATLQAQETVAQGQAKLNEFSVKRQADALLRDLGAAYYAEQRSGGNPETVAAALARLDLHAAEHGLNTH
jgi:hypothetical protein